jgi:hypothetical protein
MAQRAFVRMYCKIFDDVFPDNGFTDGRMATGDEIYSFLSKSLNLTIDPETNEALPGDACIWYIATNEKFGVLSVNEVMMEWGFGESSWDRVLVFLRELNDRFILDVHQYVSLLMLVEEGMRSFDDCFEIASYLKAKRDKQPWTKKQTNTKANIKQMVKTFQQSMESHGYRVIFPHAPTHHNNFNE